MKQFHAYCNSAIFLIMVLLCNIAPDGCATQSVDTSCINKLVPCLNYLNGTRNPPNSCCDPLKSVIKWNPKCLCSMISNKGAKQAEEAGIDVDEAQALPGRCGQRVNPIACLTNADLGGSSNSKNSVENSAFRDGSMVGFAVAISSIILQLLL